MKCLNCGAEFAPKAVNQKYCSAQCKYRYLARHRMSGEWPSLTFTCARCGKIVVTEVGYKDHRTRFCSKECERKFWRHPPWEHETARTNFHSVDEYASWERRTNE